MGFIGLIVLAIFSQPYTYSEDRVRFSEEETFLICKTSCPVPLDLTRRPEKEVMPSVKEEQIKPDPIGPIKMSIFFSPASFSLDDPSRLLLDVLIKTLGAVDLKHVRVTITGYTDSEGASEVNQKLAWKRAEAVGIYLEANGLPPESITLAGQALCCYRASNETAEGRERNRRAEVYVEVGENGKNQPGSP